MDRKLPSSSRYFGVVAGDVAERPDKKAPAVFAGAFVPELEVAL